MNINIELKPGAKVPQRSTSSAAGFDLYSNEDATILAGATHVIHTGIIMEIPDGYFGGIYARSGLATKEGLRPANCVGVIDSDYRGEICVALHNDSSSTKHVSAGERIAQLIIQSYAAPTFDVVKSVNINSTERGINGFGSTGIK